MNDPAEATEAWYCARTQPKHEHIAAANLRKRLGLDVFHPRLRLERATRRGAVRDRKSTRLNSSHLVISYAVFCLKKKKTHHYSSDLSLALTSVSCFCLIFQY